MIQLARTSRQIGTAISRQRRLLNLTQAELAAQVGLRQEAISRIEAGNDATRMSTILDVFAALGLELTIGARGKGAAKEIEDIF